jgi:hypothetical protein
MITIFAAVTSITSLAVICYIVGLGHVIDKYSREQEERANNKSNN